MRVLKSWGSSTSNRRLGSVLWILLAAGLQVGCGDDNSSGDDAVSESDEPTDDTDDSDVATDPDEEGPDAGVTDADESDEEAETEESEQTDPEEAETDEEEPPEQSEEDASTEAPIQTDAGSPEPEQPDSGTLPPEDDAGPVDPEAEPLWMLFATPQRTVVNVNSKEQRFSELDGLVELPAGTAPWSPDARYLADEDPVEDVLTIYDLADGSLAVEVPVEGLSTVLRWAGPEAVLVNTSVEGAGQGVMLVTLQGDVVEVVPPASQGLASHTTSPVGDAFLYSATGNGGFPFYYVDLGDPVSPASPLELATHTTSPSLSHVWNNDGSWLAFGVAALEGGIYLWSPGGDAPLRISPEGTNYTPLHSFSPRGDAFVSYVNGMNGAVLHYATLSGNRISNRGVLSEAVDQSHAGWSPNGQYLYYSTDGEGRLREVGLDGTISAATTIPEFEFSCSIGWRDAEFMYEACAEGSEGLRWAAGANPSAARVMEVEDIGSLGFAGQCMVQWDEAGRFRVGPLAETPELRSVNSPATAISEVTLHPQGAGFAWVVNDSSFYWQRLVDCEPVGRPVLIDAEAEITQLEFVAPR